MSISLNQAQYLREKIKYLYLNSPQIHIDVSLSKPRISLKNVPATILGTYANIFRIEESSCGVPRSHSLQYTDVIMGHIKIHELDLKD